MHKKKLIINTIKQNSERIFTVSLTIKISASSNKTMTRNEIYQIFINPHFLKFAIIGTSGICINMAFLYLFTSVMGIYYMASAIYAIEISILWNFIFNNIWTWKDRKKQKLYKKIVKYHISTGLSAILGNWLILLILTEFFSVYYLVSNLIGIAAATIANFLLSDLWTFRK